MFVANTIGPVRDVVATLRRRPFQLGSGREYTLAFLLRCMDLSQLEFATAINVTGLDELQRAVSEKRGVVVVTTHGNAGLARVILRPLYDANLPAVTISGGPGFPICGTGLTGETIAPAATFLLRVRTRLRAGFIVCAMLDAVGADERTPNHVTTDDGTTWLADPLIRMAVRWQVPIAILKASLDGNGVRLDVKIRTSVTETEVLEAMSRVKHDAATRQPALGLRKLTRVNLAHFKAAIAQPLRRARKRRRADDRLADGQHVAGKRF